MEFSRPKKLTINGVKGLLADGKAEYDGQTVEGQLFVAMVNPTQQFSLIGFAPKDRSSELIKVFDAVLGSTSFSGASGEIPSSIQKSESPSQMEIQPLRQWASSASASSEYSSTDYSALRVQSVNLMWIHVEITAMLGPPSIRIRMSGLN